MKRYRNSEGVVAKFDDALAERLRGSGWVLVDGGDEVAPSNPDPVESVNADDSQDATDMSSADDSVEPVPEDGGFDTDFTADPEPVKPARRKSTRTKKVSE